MRGYVILDKLKRKFLTRLDIPHQENFFVQKMSRNVDSFVGGQNVLHNLNFARVTSEAVVVNGNIAEAPFNVRLFGRDIAAAFFKVSPPFHSANHRLCNICAARKFSAQNFGGSQVVFEPPPKLEVPRELVARRR